MMNIENRKRASLVSLALAGGILAVAGFVFADFNSKAARKGGFAAKDGVHDGKDLSGGPGGEKEKVQAAIDKLKNNAGGASTDCEKGLQDLLDKHRICKEGGSSGNAATTLPDGKATADGDGINVRDGRITGDPDELACVLAHEWIHVAQTSPYNELPAYKAEKKCLEDLGKTGSDRHKFICCKVESLEGTKKKAKETPQQRLARMLDGGQDHFDPTLMVTAITPIPILPYSGFADRPIGDATFFITEAELGLRGFLSGTSGGTSVFPLNMLEPLNLIELAGVTGPAGGPVLAVSGAMSTNGVIDFVEVDPTTATGVQTLGSVVLPGCRPLSLSDEIYQGLHLLYVLDTQNRQVLLLFDGDGDGLPETALPTPWATVAQFTSLQTAKAIRRNVAKPLSVLLSARDLRIEDTVKLANAVPALYDTNGDGVADATQNFFEHELYAVIPWAYNAPAAGDTQLTAFCTSGDRIELWLSNASGGQVTLLGSQICGTNNQAVYPLTSPLVSGQYLILKDVTFLFGGSPVPFQVP